MFPWLDWCFKLIFGGRAAVRTPASESDLPPDWKPFPIHNGEIRSEW
jgi:hypothetical protein